MRFAPSLLVHLFLSALVVPVIAQTADFNEAVANWYQEERFLLADRNDDALLDKAEMGKVAPEFSYFLANNHFELTDKNGDQKLSFNEVRQRSYPEMMFRYQEEKNAIRVLAINYPLVDQADLSYLKSNPGLAVALLRNYVWMYDHEGLVDKLMSEVAWLNQHTEVMMALHQNLRWMAAHPRSARTLYANRSLSQRLPELQGWRSAHMSFIPKYPRLEQAYDNGFIPSGARH